MFSKLKLLCAMQSRLLICPYRVDQRRENNKILDECYSKEVDTLINVETVKVFGMEDFEVNSYDSLRTRAREMKNSFSVVSQGFSFAKSLVQSGAGTCALALAAVGASNGKLSAGDFVIINAYIGQLFSPLLVRLPYCLLLSVCETN